MPEKVDLGFAVTLEPRRAIEHFESKGHKITWDWHEADAEAHAKAFTVAKATRMDVLTTIRDEVSRALKNGTTEREFVKTLEPRLKAMGWWGKVIAVRPDGVAMPAQLGSPHRLRTIYRTNLQSAYMAGRYQAQKRLARSRPYWQYVAILDARTRPAHAALSGKVFRHDDPFWDSHYPPNGLNCRCRVRALSQARLDKEGLKVESSDGHLREVMQEVGADSRTGEIIERPAVQYTGTDRAGKPFTMTPDPGWSYNPGEGWSLWDKNGHLPDCIGGAEFATAAVAGTCLMIGDGQPSWKDFGRPDLRRVPQALRAPAPDLMPAASGVEEAVAVLARAVGLVGAQRIITTPIEDLAVRRELLVHMVEKRDNARERYGNFVLPTLTDPFEVWLTAYPDGYRRRYVGLFQGVKDLLVVVRVNQDGSLMWNILDADDRLMNRHRAGALLMAKEIK